MILTLKCGRTQNLKMILAGFWPLRNCHNILSKDKDKEAPPKYFKKKVPLWNYLEGLESKLTVAHTTGFKPVLIPARTFTCSAGKKLFFQQVCRV